MDRNKDKLREMWDRLVILLVSQPREGARVGWEPEDVVDRECVVVLKIGEDAQGFQKNKVVEVRPLGEEDDKTDGSSFDGIPY